MNNEDQIRPVEEPENVATKTKEGKGAGKKQGKISLTGNKRNGTSFKKGKSGNPKGRPKTDPAIRAIQVINNAEFVSTATRLLNMPYRKWAKQLNNVKNLPGWDAVFLAGLIKITNKGDLKTFNDVFLDRLIGATKKTIEIGTGDEEESKILSRKQFKAALLDLEKVVVDHKN